jgi:hypothetical protein
MRLSSLTMPDIFCNSSSYLPPDTSSVYITPEQIGCVLFKPFTTTVVAGSHEEVWDCVGSSLTLPSESHQPKTKSP